MISITEKQQIILAARAAARKRRKNTSNPYPIDSEQYLIWQQFYEMVQADTTRETLIAAEYESSAY